MANTLEHIDKCCHNTEMYNHSGFCGLTLTRASPDLLAFVTPRG